MLQTNEYEVAHIELASEKQKICRTIIEALEDWFGIPEANEAYIEQVSTECFLAVRTEGKVAGFISAKLHNPQSAEITVMGVSLDRHRAGIGSMLIDSLEERLKAQGVSYLTVKTLAETRACEYYEKTRRFYNAKGFVELEVINEIWGSDNPCAFMAKKL